MIDIQAKEKKKNLYLLPLEADLERLVGDEDTSIEASDSAVSFLHVGHVDKAIALAKVVHIPHDASTEDSTIGTEEILKAVLVHLVRNVVDKDADTIISNRLRRVGYNAWLLTVMTTVHATKAGVATMGAIVSLSALNNQGTRTRKGLDD